MEVTIADFIDLLKGRGYSIEHYSVSRELEITRLAHASKNPIIASVKDSRYPVYVNVLNDRARLYLALNVSGDLNAYSKVYEAQASPKKPPMRRFSEYFEKVDHGLEALPFIRYYREDGGLYLTSAIYCACIDNICNASYHRTMLIDSRRAVLRIVPRHLFKIYNEYVSKGLDAPAAIILGVHPVIEVACALSPPYGVYELYVAYALSGSFHIVKTPIYNIPVPSTASIVIEGRITREQHWEGPFVDVLRLADKRRMQPVFVVDAIYVNKQFDPMVHAIVPGLDEHIILMGFPREVSIWDSVRRVADVRGVRLLKGSGGWLIAVVSIRKSVEGESKNAIMAAFTGHPSLKMVIVVDDDINIDDRDEIDWAIATRFRASKDLIIISGVRGSSLDPSSDDGLTDKIGIDATKPLDKPSNMFKRANIP